MAVVDTEGYKLSQLDPLALPLTREDRIGVISPNPKDLGRPKNYKTFAGLPDATTDLHGLVTVASDNVVIGSPVVTAEQVLLAFKAMLEDQIDAGAGISLVYNEGAGTLTINAAGSTLDATSDQYWSGNSYSWTGSFWQMSSNQWGALDVTTDSGDTGFGWEVGFRPTSLELTVHAFDFGDGFLNSNSYFELHDTMSNVIGTVAFDFNDGMSQTKTMAITFAGFDIGQLYQSGYVYAADSGPHIDSIIFS